MKYVFMMVLVSLVAVLGCTQTPKADISPAKENVETADPTTDKYEIGTWTEDWDVAIAAAKEMQRPVLINFTGSDWCVWCFRLRDEVFVTDEFMDYAKENLVLLKLDFPRKLQQSEALIAQNQMLQRQFAIQGYPTIILADQTGQEINRTGYQPGGPQKYIEHLEELMN